jgi:peptidoglycan hydrolase-like protein with peptidoglycan-binding domain
MALQRCLNAAIGAELAVDGSFGSLTQKAVKAYQKARGLKKDGIVGKNTCEALGGMWIG